MTHRRKGSADGEFVLFLFAVMFTVAAGIGGCNLGYKTSTDDSQKAAVEAGVGEFVIVDPATGTSEFRFKKCGEAH